MCVSAGHWIHSPPPCLGVRGHVIADFQLHMRIVGRGCGNAEVGCVCVGVVMRAIADKPPEILVEVCASRVPHLPAKAWA